MKSAKYAVIASLFVIISVYFFSPFIFKMATSDRETSSADKQMESWWWSRSYPNPENVNNHFIAGWQQSQTIRNETGRYKSNSSLSRGQMINTGFGNWSSIGPKDRIGGRTLAIAINPENTNQIFIGTAGGGIWESNNGGGMWEPVVTGFPVIGVPAIVINPDNPNIIYAGTGEVYRVDTTGIGYNVWKTRGTYGVGILKSMDGGNTWTQVLEKSMGNLFGVQHLEFHPQNPEIIFACCTDGLYKSANGGNTWTNILNKIYTKDIAINSTNTDEMIVTVGNLVNSEKGLYKTTDGGNSWNKIVSAAFPVSFSGLISVESKASLVYAGFGTNGSSNELVVSADFGNSWVLKNSSNICSYQYWYCNDLAIDPLNEKKLLMCGVNLAAYTSESNTNSNGSKKQIGNIHSDAHDVIYDPSNSNIVYLATDGGMYKSTNNGASFTAINNGLAATQFYASLGVSPTDPDNIIGGLQDNGVVKYDGSTWIDVVGGDGGSTSFNPTNPNVVITNTQYRAVYVSTNGGLNYTSVLSSWASDRCAFIAPLAISKANTNFVFSATDLWHASTNGGKTFSNNNQSLTNYIDERNKSAITIAASPINAEKAIVSTSPFSQRSDNALNIKPPPNLFITQNATAANPIFTNIKNNLPDRFVLDACFSATNDDSIFVTLGGYGTPHIYVTGDGGDTWNAISDGLPDVPFNAILMDPVNPQILYAGSDLGAYVSNNRGATWFDFSNGFWDATIVFDLQITADQQLACATHGKGIFKTDLFDESILPVVLSGFKVSKASNGNLLEWKISGGEELSHFIVERSYTGNNFEKIGQVSAQNSGVGNYSFIDNFSSAQSPIYFYRIQWINKDGTRNYSGIISISNEIKTGYKIFGNPFIHSFVVQCSASFNEPVQFYLYDMNGRLMKSQTSVLTVGLNNVKITDLKSLPSGTYSLLILRSNNVYKTKVVK